jgi:DNA-binding response OmpR family regulator
MADSARHALVVDDDPSIRLMVSKILEREGFRADVAADGAEALDLIERTRYQLVVLDLMMPKVGGLEVIRSLKKNCASTLRKVIVTSAVASEVDGDLAFVCHVLPKPFDISKLMEYARECAR